MMKKFQIFVEVEVHSIFCWHWRTHHSTKGGYEYFWISEPLSISRIRWMFAITEIYELQFSSKEYCWYVFCFGLWYTESWLGQISREMCWLVLAVPTVLSLKNLQLDSMQATTLLPTCPAERWYNCQAHLSMCHFTTKMLLPHQYPLATTLSLPGEA